MGSEYIVVTYTKKEPSKAYIRNGSTGSLFDGTSLPIAERIAKELTVENFRDGVSNLGITVNKKVIDKAPDIIYI